MKVHTSIKAGETGKNDKFREYASKLVGEIREGFTNHMNLVVGLFDKFSKQVDNKIK